MSDRCTRGWTGLMPNRTDTAVAVAEQLHHECSTLMELYRAKESFAADVPDIRLVSVPPPSPQLDTKDKLGCLHSALLGCQSLLERAIDKEEEELGRENKGAYDKQRKTVKDRLSFLLNDTGELLKAVDGGSTLTPNVQLESQNSVFDLKTWVYQVYKEVDYWTKIAISTVQGLPTIITKEMARTTSSRNIRSTYMR
uniref:Ciliary neurotrophic factor n=1 Tax=Gouania willdenowi TaxID=441366 RepID=A0A8C5NHV0_GOUWI